MEIKNNTMKKQIILYIIILLSNIAYSQKPSEDPNFENLLNEEFSGTVLNPMWNIYNGEIWVPRFVDKSSTLNVSGGMLNITANYVPTSPYKFETAAIRASSSPYSIGTYFECRSKIPLGLNAYPAFWVWEGTNCEASGDYREIDIMEYWNYFKVSSSNLHFCHCTGYDSVCRTSTPRADYSVPNPNTFHIYAAYWNSKNITHVLDDYTVAEKYNIIGALKDRTKPMYIENSLQVFDMVDTTDDDITNPVNISVYSEYPMTYQTDYIRAYRLKQDCNTNVTIIPNFFTYYYALKKTIRLSGTTIVPTSLSISLRAVDEIELQNGFEVPNGSTLYLNTNECY